MAWRLIEHLKPSNRKVVHFSQRLLKLRLLILQDTHLCGTEIENLSLMKCVSGKGSDCCTKSVKIGDTKKEKTKSEIDEVSMELCPPRYCQSNAF